MYRWLRFLNLPVEFGLVVVLFTLAGYGLDQWGGTTPWATLCGGGFGFGAGLYYVWREVHRFQKRLEQEEDEKAL